MRKWLRRVRAAVSLGVVWAVAWAMGGLTIGVASNILPDAMLGWFFEVFDAPLPALAMPGFAGGVIFSMVLAAAGRHRRFNDLSLARFAVWGALGGALLALLPLAVVGMGLGTLNESAWSLMAAIGGPCVVFSAGSAVLSLKVARLSQGAGDAHALSVAPGPGDDTPART